MVRRVGRIVIAAAAIGAALLVGNVAVSVYHTAQLRHESAAVLRSNELLLALDNVLSLVKDAESGQRGYVITGRQEYLAPYRAAVGSIQAQMDALERLTRADPVQERLMADVRRRVGAKLGELELTVGLRDRKGFDLTRDVILLGAGRAEMEALRATAAEMAAHETERLVAREAAADRTYRAALVGEALSTLAALAALIGLSILLARHLRARDAAEGGDLGAGRAPAHDARQHRRRGHHDRPRRPRRRPQPGRRVAHRLGRRRSARAAARGGLSHRQRIDPPAGREPGDARAARRRDRRPRQPHAADPQGRVGGADRRQRGADPRPPGPGARLHPRLSRHQREEGGRARDRRGAGAAAARRHRHGDPDHGLRRGRRGRPRQRRLDRHQRLQRRRAGDDSGNGRRRPMARAPRR